MIRSWATGDHAPGRALWSRLAEAGVFALAVPPEHEGFGPLPVELAVAFEALGRHAVPGPLVETVAAAALLDRLGDPDTAAARLPAIASGTSLVSLCLTSLGPYALDADAADAVFVVDGDTLRLAAGPGPVQPSADPARRLSRPSGGAVVARGPEVTAAAGYAADVAALATAAQALGVGRTLLARTVAYVTQRTQFGVAIGSFQAVKHRLADTLLALEFTEPLVHGAALALAMRRRRGRARDRRGQGHRGRGRVRGGAHRPPAARCGGLYRRARPVPVDPQGPSATGRLGHPGRVPDPGTGRLTAHGGEQPDEAD